jgi:hypothetical protein
VGRGRRGERGKRVNMWQILYRHLYKWKMRPIKIIPECGEGRIKENDGGGEFSYDIFDTL